MRFLLLGLFQRAYSLSPLHSAIGIEWFYSWKSLFFYRCTDVISFAPLKSQSIGLRPRKTSASSEPQSIGSDLKNISARGHPPEPHSAVGSRPSRNGTPPQQPRGANSRADGVVGWSTSVESQVVDSFLNLLGKNTVAASPPPCSPKSIYILANLVR